MPIHHPIQNGGIYFITFTCYQWIPLIDKTNSYDLVYKWFDVLSSKDNTVVGYVIMPNHMHLLINYAYIKQTLNTIIGNGKRFLAYSIINRLKDAKDLNLLKILHAAVQPNESARGKKHEVWEDSFDVKYCRTEKFILQKLIYMHDNPCVERWKLSDRPINYYHSSASFYECGQKNYPRLRDYRDFLCYGKD
jgi:REP element-mobilizing transposase RayT